MKYPSVFCVYYSKYIDLVSNKICNTWTKFIGPSVFAFPWSRRWLLGKDSVMLCRCWSASKRRFEPFVHEIALFLFPYPTDLPLMVVLERLRLPIVYA